MALRVTGAAALACLALSVSGCSWFYGQTSTAGPHPFRMNYETVDLIHLLDPEGRARDANLNGSAKDWDSLDQGQQIDLAFAQYHTTMQSKSAIEQVASRDEIQERLLGASNQLCHQYQQAMQNVNSTGNFAFGTLATLAGAAGALVTGGTSQILSGTAAAASGTRAEFNQDFFYGVTVAAIFDGIQQKRKEDYTNILQSRREASNPPATEDEAKVSVAAYSIEAAIKDAIFFHSQCSLVAGVQTLQDKLKLADNPGLDMVAKTLVKFNIAQNIATTKSINPADVEGSTLPTAAQLAEGQHDPVASYGAFLLSAMAMRDDVKQYAASFASLAGADDAKTPGKKYLERLNTTVDARAATAAAEVASCQATAAMAQKEIMDARADLATVTDSNAKIMKQAAVTTAAQGGDMVITQMRPATDGLSADLTVLRKAIGDATVDPKKALDVAGIDSALTVLAGHTLADDAAKKALACAPKSPPA